MLARLSSRKEGLDGSRRVWDANGEPATSFSTGAGGVTEDVFSTSGTVM